MLDQRWQQPWLLLLSIVVLSAHATGRAHPLGVSGRLRAMGSHEAMFDDQQPLQQQVDSETKVSSGQADNERLFDSAGGLPHADNSRIPKVASNGAQDHTSTDSELDSAVGAATQVQAVAGMVVLVGPRDLLSSQDGWQSAQDKQLYAKRHNYSFQLLELDCEAGSVNNARQSEGDLASKEAVADTLAAGGSTLRQQQQAQGWQTQRTCLQQKHRQGYRLLEQHPGVWLWLVGVHTLITNLNTSLADLHDAARAAQRSRVHGASSHGGTAGGIVGAGRLLLAREDDHHPYGPVSTHPRRGLLPMSRTPLEGSAGTQRARRPLHHAVSRPRSVTRAPYGTGLGSEGLQPGRRGRGRALMAPGVPTARAGAGQRSRGAGSTPDKPLFITAPRCSQADGGLTSVLVYSCEATRALWAAIMREAGTDRDTAGVDPTAPYVTTAGTPRSGADGTSDPTAGHSSGSASSGKPSSGRSRTGPAALSEWDALWRAVTYSRAPPGLVYVARAAGGAAPVAACGSKWAPGDLLAILPAGHTHLFTWYWSHRDELGRGVVTPDNAHPPTASTSTHALEGGDTGTGMTLSGLPGAGQHNGARDTGRRQSEAGTSVQGAAGSSSDLPQYSSLGAAQPIVGGAWLAVLRVLAPVLGAVIVVLTAYLPLLYWSWTAEPGGAGLTWRRVLTWRSYVLDLRLM